MSSAHQGARQGDKTQTQRVFEDDESLTDSPTPMIAARCGFGSIWKLRMAATIAVGIRKPEGLSA